MLTIEAVLNEISFRIQIVENLIRVARVACCKDHHLIFTLQTFQQFNCSWPNINACFSLLSSGKFNRNFEVMFMRYALIAVYECLIEVKYDGFFIFCSFFALECEYFRFQLLLTGHF